LSIDTLKADRQVYSERLAAEVMSGGDVKASPRQPEKRPQELKAQEGIEWLAGLNPLLAATIAARIKALKAERAELALEGQPTRRRSSVTTGGYDPSMRWAGRVAGKPPEERIPDVVVG
jgi:hypothetical protein